MAGAKDRVRIAPPAVVGIIGGGQLGRMSALAARAMGYRVVVLEPKTPCACGPVADEQIVAAYDDPGALERLFSIADAVTFEFENVRKEPLEASAGASPSARPRKSFPSPRTGGGRRSFSPTGVFPWLRSG